MALIRGRRRSLIMDSPMSEPRPTTTLKTPAKSCLSMMGAIMFRAARAVRGVFDEGFQITESPQTAAIMAFQDQTATGKLKAVMTPIRPRGCHCS